MAIQKTPLALILASLTISPYVAAQTEQTMQTVTVTGESDAGYRISSSNSASKIDAAARHSADRQRGASPVAA
jgi:catecholate siderophore receptor